MFDDRKVSQRIGCMSSASNSQPKCTTAIQGPKTPMRCLGILLLLATLAGGRHSWACAGKKKLIYISVGFIDSKQIGTSSLQMAGTRSFGLGDHDSHIKPGDFSSLFGYFLSQAKRS